MVVLLIFNLIFTVFYTTQETFRPAPPPNPTKSR